MKINIAFPHSLWKNLPANNNDCGKDQNMTRSYVKRFALIWWYYDGQKWKARLKYCITFISVLIYVLFPNFHEYSTQDSWALRSWHFCPCLLFTFFLPVNRRNGRPREVQHAENSFTVLVHYINNSGGPIDWSEYVNTPVRSLWAS